MAEIVKKNRWLLAAVPFGVGLLAACAPPPAEAPPVTASVSADVLTVTGTPAEDAITLRLRSGDSTVLEVDVDADGDADFSFDRATFTAIVLDGGAGGDQLVLDSGNGPFTDTEATTVSGGGGNDQLVGTTGGETLDGGSGNDIVEGNQGTDTLLGGSEADIFKWDPGDGSDTVDGGPGSNRLAFNGSGAAEIFDVSAVGDHVQFSRDVGNVVLDLDNIGRIDLATAGGADVVTVADVAGTDLVRLDTNLAATGGGDDGEVDEIVAPPGVAVTSDGAAGVVNGLGAQVRVLNGSPSDRVHITGPGIDDQVLLDGTGGADTVAVVASGTDVLATGVMPSAQVLLTGIERLDTDLRAGADQFSATGNLAALTKLTVSGGDGDDTILGGNGVDVIDAGPGADFVDGQQGNDVAFGGDGTDTFQWDPGDGSDVLEGQAQDDVLAFNASNAGESIQVVANGSRARLTRNVGAIVMDLDGTEKIELSTLGGADVVDVGNLAGTAVTGVEVDLAGAGGADDGQVDSVTVPPGVTVGRDATAAVVSGLSAQLRVVNGSAADDVHVTGPGVVSVVGTSGADAVVATAAGTDVLVTGATPGVSLRLTTIGTLDVALGGDGDTFSATGNLAALVAMEIDGGDGVDTIVGGNGVDVIQGGPGDDVIDAQQGNDVVFGDDGADMFQWDPGDGSDVLEGGADVDVLVFNSSNAAEIINVLANGTRTRLTRNVGSIVMDLDDVETLDLRTLGGADAVQVGDLSGTDVTGVDVGLAASGGGDDAQPDAVTVNGTAGDDTIAVTAPGSTVVVGGLPWQVRITGSTAALDALTVNGGNGADTITVAPAVSTLIQPTAVP